MRLRYLVLYNDPVEFLFGVVPIGVWSLVEEGVGIIAGSLAALRPLFKNLSFLRSSSGGTSNGVSSSGRLGFTSHFSSRGAHRKGSMKMQNLVSTSATSDLERGSSKDPFGDSNSQMNILKETNVNIVTTNFDASRPVAQHPYSVG